MFANATPFCFICINVGEEMKKETILLLTSVFILVYGTFISGTVLTPYAKSLGATGTSIGIISGALYLVRLFAGTPIGRLADKRGILVVLKYSLILYPFVALSYWTAVSVPALIGARLLHGLASAMMLPMAMAYIGKITPKGEEGRYMGIYNTVVLLASGLGPQTAAVIAAEYEPKTSFLLLFALALISLLLVLILRNSKENESVPKEEYKKRRNSASPLFHNSNLIALCIINIALAVVSSLVGYFFILYPPTKGISMIFSGSIIAIYNLICGISQIPIGRFTDKYKKCRMIQITGALTTVTLILFPFASRLWSLLAIMVLLAFVSAALLSASSALSTVLGRSNGMGSTMGFLGTSSSIGMVLGSMSLGTMADRFGIDSTFFLSGTLVFLCIIFFSVFWKETEE